MAKQRRIVPPPKKKKKGASTYDVCAGRGKEVPQKQTRVLISCVSVTLTRGVKVTKWQNLIPSFP